MANDVSFKISATADTTGIEEVRQALEQLLAAIPGLQDQLESLGQGSAANMDTLAASAQMGAEGITATGQAADTAAQAWQVFEEAGIGVTEQVTAAGAAAESAAGQLETTGGSAEAAGESLGHAGDQASAAAAAVAGLDSEALGPIVETFNAAKEAVTAFAEDGLGGLTVAGGAVLGVMGLLGADAGNLVGQMVTIKDTLGLTAEEADTLALRFEDVGKSADVLVRVGAMISTVMTQAADAVAKGNEESLKARTIQDQLGVAIFNADGSLREQGQVLQEVLDKLGTMTNRTEAARIAAELFGSRMAGNIIPALNDWQAATERVQQQSERLGLSTQDLDRINQQYHTSLTDIEIEVQRVGLQVLPALTSALKAVGDAIATAEDAAQPFISGLEAIDDKTGLVKDVLEALAILIGIQLAESLVGLVAKLGAATLGMEAFGAAAATAEAETAAAAGGGLAAFAGGVTGIGIQAALAYPLVRLLDSQLNQLTDHSKTAAQVQAEFQAALAGSTDKAVIQNQAFNDLNKATKDYQDLTDGLPGHINNAFTALGNLVGITSSSKQEFNNLSKEVANAATELVNAGASADQLNAAQAELPPQLQAIFEKAVQAAGGVQQHADAMDNATTAAKNETDALATLAQATAAQAQTLVDLGLTGASLTKIGTGPDALDKFREEQAKKADEAAKKAAADAKKVAEAAQKAWTDSWENQSALADANAAVEAEFGKTGGKVIESFSAALSDPTKTPALRQAVDALIAEAEKAGVPDAADLGKQLINAIGDGLQTGDSSGVYAAMHALADSLSPVAVESAKVAKQIQDDQDKIAKATSDSADKVAAATKKEQQDLADLAKSHDEALAKIEKSHTEADNRIRASHSKNMAQQLADEQQHYQDALTQENQSYADRKAKREQNYKDQLDQLGTALDNQTETWKKHIQDLGGVVDPAMEQVGKDATAALGTGLSDPGQLTTALQTIEDTMVKALGGAGTQAGDAFKAAFDAAIATVGKTASKSGGLPPGFADPSGARAGGASSAPAVTTGPHFGYVPKGSNPFDASGHSLIDFSKPYAIGPGGVPYQIPGLASGLDFVPYDGFIASLHRGERVVPASQNQGGGGGIHLYFSGPVNLGSGAQNQLRQLGLAVANEMASRGVRVV